MPGMSIMPGVRGTSGPQALAGMPGMLQISPPTTFSVDIFSVDGKLFRRRKNIPSTENFSVDGKFFRRRNIFRRRNNFPSTEYFQSAEKPSMLSAQSKTQ